MPRERFTKPLAAVGGLLDAAAGVILLNYARIDIGRGDIDNAAKEAFGVILSVGMAAFVARALGRGPQSQNRNTS